MKSDFIPVMCISLTSIIVSVFCIGLYFFKRKYVSKDFSIFFLVNQILDLILCINTLINSSGSTGDLCIFQGFCDQFTGVLLIEWNVIIMYKIYAEIFNKKFNLVFMSLVSFIISFIIAIIPVFLEYYGKNLIYCTFKTTGDHSYLIIICFYIPLWLSSIAIVYMLSKIEKTSKKRMFDRSSRNEFMHTLRLFPISLIFCHFFISVSRLLEIFQGNTSKEEFLVSSICLCRTHGIINGIISLRCYWKNFKVKIVEKSSESIDQISQIIMDESTIKN